MNLSRIILVAIVILNGLLAQNNFNPGRNDIQVAPGDGLTGYYYERYVFRDTLIAFDILTLSFTRVDTVIDFWDGNPYFAWQPVSGWADYYSVKWEGYIYIEQSG